MDTPGTENESASVETPVLKKPISVEKGAVDAVFPSKTLTLARSGRKISTSRLAQSSRPVLLLGEDGTGKRAIARILHQLSQRSSGPFVDLDCGAVPELPSRDEKFDREKGAFAGAISREISKMQLTRRGTLYLRDVDELPLSNQPDCVRILDGFRSEGVGGTETPVSEVRVIAGTSSDLAAMVKERRFRKALYRRLAGVVVRVPSLRERQEAIHMLTRYFLMEACAQERRERLRLSDEAAEVLAAYRWPGNLRELKNIMATAVVLCRGDTVQVADLDLDGSEPGSRVEQEMGTLAEILAEIEHRIILNMLIKTGWVIQGAAKKLGMPESTLRSRMKRLGIGRPEEPQDIAETRDNSDQGEPNANRC